MQSTIAGMQTTGMFGFSSNIAQDQEGNIIVSNYSGSKKVGVTTEKYDELQKITNEALEKSEKYYNRLVELGDIVIPKTNEDLIKDMFEIVKSLSNEVENLKKQNSGVAVDGQPHANSKNDSGKGSPNSGQNGAGSELCGPIQTK